MNVKLYFYVLPLCFTLRNKRERELEEKLVSKKAIAARENATRVKMPFYFHDADVQSSEFIHLYFSYLHSNCT